MVLTVHILSADIGVTLLFTQLYDSFFKLCFGKFSFFKNIIQYAHPHYEIGMY